jgi:transcription factor C subunit 3
MEKTKEKAKKTQKRADETKLSLAKKAEESRKQREQEWVALLLNTHPVPLTGPSAVRVERVRCQFLQAGSTKDVSRWENEIQAALREADLASSKSLKMSTKRAFTSKPLPANSTQSQIVSNPLETSIQNLIELQGPPQYKAAKPKRKKDRSLNNGTYPTSHLAVFLTNHFRRTRKGTSTPPISMESRTR